MYSHEDLLVLWELTKNEEVSDQVGNANVNNNPAKLSELIERVQSDNDGGVSVKTWCEFFKKLDVSFKLKFVSWHKSSLAGVYKQNLTPDGDVKILPHFLFEALLEDNDNVITAQLATRAGIPPEVVEFLLEKDDKEILNILSHNEDTPPRSLDEIFRKLKEEPNLESLKGTILEGLAAHPHITENIIYHCSLRPVWTGGPLRTTADCVNYLNAVRGEFFTFEMYGTLLKNDKLEPETLTEQAGIIQEVVTFYEKLTTRDEQLAFTEEVGFNPQVFQLNIFANRNCPVFLVRECINVESLKMLKNEDEYRHLHELKYEAFGRLLSSEKLTVRDIEQYYALMKDSGNISAKLGFLRNSKTPISVVGDILEQLKSEKPEHTSIVRKVLTSLAITMAEEKMQERHR